MLRTLCFSVPDFPVGNLPLEDHHAELRQRGFDVAADAWVSTADLTALGDDETLVDPAGHRLLRRPGVSGPTRTARKSFRIQHPWQWLIANEDWLKSQTAHEKLGIVHPLAAVGDQVHIGPGTRILPGVVIEGPVTIGSDCKIGPNCYIRGHSSIGDRCHVGNAVEIKNSILLPDSHVGHLSYVGDSILGRGVNLGGGTITSNYRHDAATHRFRGEDGTLHDTGRTKLGAVLGDGVHTGIHTSIYPGRYLPPGTTTRPGSVYR